MSEAYSQYNDVDCFDYFKRYSQYNDVDCFDYFQSYFCTLGVNLLVLA